MTLLHAIRRLRYSLGRGLVAVFAFAWLGLVMHDCALAGETVASDAIAVVAHGDHGAMHGGEASSDGHGPDCCCCDEQAAVPHCLTPACGASAVTLQSDGQPLFQVEPVKLVALSETPVEVSAGYAAPAAHVPVYRALYLSPHPTLRYCTLLI